MYAVCRSILSPLDACPCSLGPAKWRGLMSLLLDESVPGMQVTQKAGYTQVQVLGLSTCGCVSDDAVVDAGSGLLFRCVSFQLHLKGAPKLEVMAHLLEA